MHMHLEKLRSPVTTSTLYGIQTANSILNRFYVGARDQ